MYTTGLDGRFTARSNNETNGVFQYRAEGSSVREGSDRKRKQLVYGAVVMMWLPVAYLCLPGELQYR